MAGSRDRETLEVLLVLIRDQLGGNALCLKAIGSRAANKERRQSWADFMWDLLLRVTIKEGLDLLTECTGQDLVSTRKTGEGSRVSTGYRGHQGDALSLFKSLVRAAWS